MHIKTILTLIVLCIITPHAYTMKLELVPLQKTEKVNFTIDYDCPFLKLPSECIDAIIFYNKPATIGALKSTCKKLESLASLLRVNDQPLYQFIMPDDRKEKEERTAFFKRITATDNAAYIEKIIEYGKREMHKYKTIESKDSIIILLDGSSDSSEDEPLDASEDEPISPDTTTSVSEKSLEQAYINVEYLPFLLRHAIKQNKFTSVLALTKNGADMVHYGDQTPLEYAAQRDSDAAIQALFECNTFTPKEIEAALDMAWYHNNRKSLELLSTKLENNRYTTALEKERCQFIKQLALTASMITFVVCTFATGLTLHVLGYVCHKNATHPCF